MLSNIFHVLKETIVPSRLLNTVKIYFQKEASAFHPSSSLSVICQPSFYLIHCWWFPLLGSSKFLYTCLPLTVPFGIRSITSIINEIKMVFDFSMLNISCDSRRNFFHALCIFELILVLSLIKRSANLRKMESVPWILISK